MALRIGYLARTALAFVLLAAGTYSAYVGYLLGETTLFFVGMFISWAGAAVATYNEMRRITEGIPGTG